MDHILSPVPDTQQNVSRFLRVGGLIGVATKDKDGLLSKKNCFVNASAGNSYTRLSYSLSNTVFYGSIIGSVEQGSSAHILHIAFSKGQYGSNFVAVTTSGAAKIKYVYTDSTFDLYIMNGNINLMLLGSSNINVSSK